MGSTGMGDYVLIKFARNQTVQYYIALITEIKQFDKLTENV